LLDESSIAYQYIEQLRSAMTLGCEEDVRFCPGRRKEPTSYFHICQDEHLVPAASL
jgi:hypothetical protein